MSEYERVTAVDISLEEDNLGDVALARDLFRNRKQYNDRHVVLDGEKALACLRRQGA